ncbi:hypothetical protein D3C75_597640 [compost metagenome]
MFSQRAMQQAPFFVLIRFARFAWLPRCDKTFIGRCNDVRFDFEEIFSDEILNFFVATHHQPEYRRLHAPDGEHTLITRITPKNGVSAGHVDAVKPVGTGTSQS